MTDHDPQTTFESGAWIASGFDAARTLPLSVQTAVLDTADRRRDAHPHDAERAVFWYVALADRVFDSPDRAEARTRWVVQNVRQLDAPSESFLRRAGAQSADHAVRQRARIGAALCAGTRGDHRRAGARLRDVLREERGTGSKAEADAAVNLAFLCLRHSRGLETLLLARRAENVYAALDHGNGRAAAISHRLELFAVFEFWDGVAHALEELEPLVHAPGAERYGGLLAEGRAHLHAGRGEEPQALRAITELEEHCVRTPLIRRLLLAGIRLREMRPRDGLALLDELDGDEARRDLYWFRREVLRARCAAELPNDAHTRRIGSEVLNQLAGLGAGHVGADGVRLIALRLADAYRRQGAAPLEARAIEIAAGAALDRLGELHETLSDLPHQPELSPIDRQCLVLVDRELTPDLPVFHTQVRERLDAAVRDRVLWATQLRAGAADSPVLCAWCGDVRIGAGHWLPTSRLFAVCATDRSTHGICPRCSGTFREELRGMRTP